MTTETPDWLEFDLILFDLDDTLINTRASVRHGIETALSTVPLPEPHTVESAVPLLTEFIKHFGTTADHDYWQAFSIEITQSYEQPHSLGIQLRDTYREHYWKHLQPFQGVVDFLNNLVQKQKNIGLVTNGILNFQEKKLKHTGLKPFFEESMIFCSGEYEPIEKKPSPHMLHEVLKQQGISPKKTVFFGNADLDILAGNLAGVVTVAVDHYPNVANISLLKANYELHNWPTLV